MRRRTKKLLIRLLPIVVIFIGINTGFLVSHFLRIPSEWYTGNYLGEYSSVNRDFNVDTQNGLVYMSSGNSCKIIDVDNPSNPTLLAEYDKESPAIFISREDDLLLISGEHDVNIVDISNPSTPTNLSSFQIHTNYSVSDLAINGDYAFVLVVPDNSYVEPDLFYQGMYVFNITDPNNPSQVALYKRYGIYALSITIHQDIAYIANRYSSILLLNITNPAHPTNLGILIGFGLVPTLPYAVNPVSSGIKVSPSAKYIIIADYDNGYIVADVSSPTNPQPGSGTIMGNCISIDITFDYSYLLQENGTVSVYSMENPSALRIVGRFDSYESFVDARDIHVHQATQKMYVLNRDGLTIVQLIEGEHNDYYREEAKSETLLIAIVLSFVICVPLGIAIVMRHTDKNKYTSRY